MTGGGDRGCFMRTLHAWAENCDFGTATCDSLGDRLVPGGGVRDKNLSPLLQVRKLPELVKQQNKRQEEHLPKPESSL